MNLCFMGYFQPVIMKMIYNIVIAIPLTSWNVKALKQRRGNTVFRDQKVRFFFFIFFIFFSSTRVFMCFCLFCNVKLTSDHYINLGSHENKIAFTGLASTDIMHCSIITIGWSFRDDISAQKKFISPVKSVVSFTLDFIFVIRIIYHIIDSSYHFFLFTSSYDLLTCKNN